MKKYLYLLLFCTVSLFASTPQQSFWDTYTSALRGDPEAQFLVGVIYNQGIGVEQNLTTAAQWFEKSAQQGHVDAQYNIGLMYATGKGVSENISSAITWLGRAADQGDNDAKRLLSELKPPPVINKGASFSENTLKEIVAISPTVLYTKKNGSVCDDNNLCITLKMPMVFTSISKRGTSYKINGTLTKKGWTRYSKVGWIDEDSIDHKK